MLRFHSVCKLGAVDHVSPCSIMFTSVLSICCYLLFQGRGPESALGTELHYINFVCVLVVAAVGIRAPLGGVVGGSEGTLIECTIIMSRHDRNFNLPVFFLNSFVLTVDYSLVTSHYIVARSCDCLIWSYVKQSG